MMFWGRMPPLKSFVGLSLRAKGAISLIFFVARLGQVRQRLPVFWQGLYCVSTQLSKGILVISAYLAVPF
jgi:hypothetical protein